MSRTSAETAALERDGPTCRRCGRSVEGQLGSLHHRKLKGRATPKRDYDLVENLVVLCGTGTSADGCHSWCHGHPKDAHEEGWVCWSWEKPAERPCQTTYRTLVMFLADGTAVEDDLGPPITDDNPPF
jgi:hypothetical protein